MMSNAKDILKELETIGAVGDKVQEPVVRRAAPSLVVVKEPVQVPQPKRVPLPSNVLGGLSEQLTVLRETLQGVLEWCEAAQDALQDSAEAEEAEEGVEVEEVVVEATADGDDEPETSSAEAEMEPPPPPIETVKPKLSLDEIRKHFLDPAFKPTMKVNGNGVGDAVDHPTVPPLNKEEGTSE